ncbi:MAG: glutamine amidotransferase, partial [Myxococcota bacterium]
MTPPRPQTLPTILLILHTPNGSPGYVGQAFKNHGFALKEVRTCHEPLPHDLSRYAGVVSFGGPMSANDESLELIRNELRWLPQVLRAQLPFLGICLGAQMMARVLGAQVSRHPECLLEAGYYPIEPTPEGRSTFGGPMAVYHWHQEGFTLPRSAVLL